MLVTVVMLVTVMLVTVILLVTALMEFNAGYKGISGESGKTREWYINANDNGDVSDHWPWGKVGNSGNASNG